MENEQKRKHRADTGPRLIDRDIDALAWIAQQYCIRLDHLAILLAKLIEPGEYAQAPKESGQLTEKRTSAIVKRWQELGLIEKKWILHGDPPWIWLTPDGLRLVEQKVGKLRRYKPSPGTLNHYYHINLTRLYVEAKRPDIEWISERQIRSNHKIGPGKKQHPPDAIARTKDRAIAIEVELSTKTYTRLNTILHNLALNAEYHTIWYFCKGTANDIVKAAIDKMPEIHHSKFVLYNFVQLHTSTAQQAEAPGNVK